MNRSLSEADPQIVQIMLQDLDRLQNCLTLIPSENYVSRAVMQMQASVLTSKYAEGTPGARYYNGCAAADGVESLAIERAKQLFGVDHVNVQPHAGNLANMAAYQALLERGDTILSMRLDHGGHLSHGLPQNFSGQYYNVVSYGVDPETEQIDINMIAELAKAHQPKLIIVGGSAYPRWFDFAGMERSCRFRRRISDGGHRPYCGSHCRRCTSGSGASLRRDNHNDSQNLARTTRRNCDVSG